MRIRSSLTGLIAALGILVAVSGADAHAKLVQSSPAAGAVLDKAPESITLKFNEAVTAKLSRVVLATGNGGSIATGPVAGDPNDKTELVAPITSALSPGKYHVSWSVVSADMHKVAGAFDFEVKQ